MAAVGRVRVPVSSSQLADLAAVSGVGRAKLERYADEVLAIVAAG